MERRKEKYEVGEIKKIVAIKKLEKIKQTKCFIIEIKK
jgi:hypothetical protein